MDVRAGILSTARRQVDQQKKIQQDYMAMGTQSERHSERYSIYGIFFG
jgi:hypothetical protein